MRPPLPSIFRTLLMAPLALVVLAGSLGAQDAKIQSAMSAAPPSVSADATVMDWDMTVLRTGSNDWTCLPDMPDTPSTDPMCLDEPWIEWLHAFMNQSTPEIDRVGFGYMLQPPGGGASNTDPYAQGPTADNEWVESEPPHVMMIVPDASMLRGLPTSPDGGGPWVMWRDTPLAHVMIPTVPRPPAAGGVIAFSQNKCPYENLSELDQLMDETFAPALDQMVADGAFTGWGLLEHAWGDEWNWNIWYSAESHGAFVEGWATYVAHLNENHPGWSQRTLGLCTDHKDNIYRVTR